MGMDVGDTGQAQLRRPPYIQGFVAGFWIVALILLLITTFYTVPADSVAVVQRFGKYVRTDDPGLRFK
jgi:regulator of protease activity HflC (stomatin/prohibitin superfamily)